MSLEQISKILKRLNILPFDENKGERLVAEYVPDVQKILEEKKFHSPHGVGKKNKVLKMQKV